MGTRTFLYCTAEVAVARRFVRRTVLVRLWVRSALAAGDYSLISNGGLTQNSFLALPYHSPARPSGVLNVSILERVGGFW